MSTVFPQVERIPLSSAFRFVHEPLGTSEVQWSRFVGRDSELDDLVSRIVLSNGGAFLLTGYRGVGKTTFVNRVIHEVRQRLPLAEGFVGESRVVDISFNFARPLKPVELLYHLVRGLHRRLSDLDILRHLDPSLRQDLELAVARTSATVAVGNETEALNEIGTSDSAIGLLGASIPLQLKRSMKRVSSRDLTYLAYDEKSAEHDLIAIAQQLTRGYVQRDRRLLPWPWRPVRRIQLKVVMVFDELDKLDDDRSTDTRQPPLDRILGTLKNLFTTSGLTFIFVAGKGLHERWLEDLSRGDSVFESVFAYAQYLSGMWADVDRLCDSLVGATDHVPAMHTAAYDAFRKYLAYKGRGIPRRTIRGFNEFVRWDEAAPRLEFEQSDVRRFRFYAGLLDTLVHAEEELLGRYRGEGSVEQLDKRRLGLYYATDWILQREQQEFTLDDLVRASQRMSRLITPVEEAAPGELQRLLDVLQRGEYVEVAELVPGTVIAGVKVEPRTTRYRLPRRRLLELGAFLGLFEQEAQALFKGASPAPQVPGATDADVVSWSARYEVVSQIGRGAMSTVYLVRDRQTGRQAALKELSRELSGNPALRTRAQAEGRVLHALNHQGIVKIFDLWVRDDAVALVMEYLQGLPLGDVLKHGPLTDMAVAARLMADLASAVAYIHEQGVVWRDPKPGNVFITPEGRVVILDFGIARQGGGSGGTEVGTVLGTPGYMSPEQAQGTVVDSRSDVFGLGVLFFEAVTGRRPFSGTTVYEFISQLLSPAAAPKVSSIAPGADVFDRIVERCLAKTPADRMTARELHDLLAPEAAPPAALGRYVMSLQTQSADREEIHTVVFAPAPAAPSAPPASAVAAAPASPEAPVAMPVSAPGTVFPESMPSMVPSPVSAAVPVATVTHRAVTRLEFVGSDRSVSLLGKSTRLGRSSENDVVLDDPTVSRYAAEVLQGDTIIAPLGEHTYYVKDLNSRNGLLLNGKPSAEIAQLRDGDELAIGAVRLRFKYRS